MKRRLLLKPINVDKGGAALCLRSSNCHYAWTNYTRSLVGKQDGFSATAVIEVYETDDTDQHR